MSYLIVFYQSGYLAPQSHQKKENKTNNSHLLVDVLTEVHVLGQTLAAVFQVDTQEHFICEVLLGLSKTSVQLMTHTQERKCFENTFSEKQMKGALMLNLFLIMIITLHL